jgi:hypothetical protein
MKRNDEVKRATELVGGFSMPSKMPFMSSLLVKGRVECELQKALKKNEEKG